MTEYCCLWSYLQTPGQGLDIVPRVIVRMYSDAPSRIAPRWEKYALLTLRGLESDSYKVA